MKEFIKWLFGIKKPVVDSMEECKPNVYPSAKCEKPEDIFDIEHHPHSGRYFPRCNQKYMYFWLSRQNYSLEEKIDGCVYGDSENMARDIIKVFKELRGINTNIIKL